MSGMAALAFMLLIVANASAQALTCPAMQKQALAHIAERCAEQAAGSLCLGGATVTPVLRGPTQTAALLEAPGDAIAIADIDWLSVSSEDDTWGAARARFPIYPSDGLEARDSTLLAFGNVALFLPEAAQRSPTLADVKVTAAQGANLRALPSTEAPIVAKLAVSRGLKAVGRLRGGDWLLIYATPELRGWISQSVVSEPAEDLPRLDADSETAPLWLPWHRFDFRSGIGDAPCAGAPESGILLQSPKTASPPHFVINGAGIRLNGTAWLQAQVSSGMFVHVLDGRARLSTAAGDVALSSGQFSQVMLERAEDGEMTATALTEPAVYDYQALRVLPIGALPAETRVALDRFTVAAPAPAGGVSPLEALAADAPCMFSAARSGANIRSRPDPQAPIIAVLAYRESAAPIARGIGADSLPWWKLADGIWVRVDATVSGGNCQDLPLLRAES